MRAAPPIPAAPLARHGLITTRELTAAGLSHSAIGKRVQRGALFRRYHGVYSLSPGALSREGEWAAALLAAGDDAVLCRLSAAVLWQTWRYREDAIDILLPRRHVPIPGVRLYTCRSLDPRDVYVHRGIRVTTVARMLVDLTDALIAGRFNLAATRRTMARANGCRRLGVLEQALEDYLNGSAGLKSRKERAFLALVRDHGLPPPRVNVHVEGIEVDFHWPRDRLVVEVDGDHHERPPTRRDDERRDAELRAAGWTVLRVTARELERAPARVIERVKGYLG